MYHAIIRPIFKRNDRQTRFVFKVMGSMNNSMLCLVSGRCCTKWIDAKVGCTRPI